MNPSTTLARAVVDGLLAAGVRHVVLAPGSRSAPLAYEVQAADRAGRLTLHVRVDERSAGFLALGLAKLSRVPAVVVTTSGTAVANLHPAVLEAHHGLVPLVVLSADRPAELRGIGANQTTTQPGMFGEATRFSAELDGAEGDASSWAAVAAAAARAARGGATATAAAGAPPGPVHLNVALREPLVPDLGEVPRVEWPETTGEGAGPGGGEPRIPEMLRLPDRTLVVIGDLPEPGQARRVAEWAGDLGWPVVAEPFGEQPLGPTVVPHGPLVLDTAWSAAHPPEHIVVAGRVTLSRSVRLALTGDPERVTYLRAGPRWLGPSFEVGRTVDLDDALLGTIGPPGAGRVRWASLWRTAGATVGSAVAHELPWGSGPALARALAAALPDGATLVVGSSNSVRDLEIAVDWSAMARTTVTANRGLAGIDGVVSTAAGVALAHRSATYALVGDLTFLHDVNALLIGPHEPRPDLTVVVVNDDGGGIFGTLEPGEPARADDFERVFGTATGARIEDLARAYGIGYARARTAAELAAAVAVPPRGLRVVEVPIDRRGHRVLRERLREMAERATAELVDPPPPQPGRPDRDYPERGMRV
ncbi:MAG: 2-succinyl-5-enolpyruvyl-6-hydroxy-3-cyclohexene-1-carboxylic-acid synthase [Dermatophilaceae bacterium]